MIKYFSSALLLLITTVCFPQWVKLENIKVIQNNDTLFNPFAGGLNNPQFSSVDLNMDGKKDIFIYERSYKGRIKTFINEGDTGEIRYKYTDIYNSKFPVLHDWVIFADYNCDNKEDIFTAIPAGIKVYRNDSDPMNGLKFTLVISETAGLQTLDSTMEKLLFVNSVEFPSINDIDNDGDLDILAFDPGSEKVVFHKNMTMEKYNHCDSLDFQIQTECWGKFKDNSSSNDVILYACRKHPSGSTIMTFDADGDGDKDMLKGNLYSNNLYLLRNGNDSSFAIIDSVDYKFPSNDVPVNINIFPISFFLDVNNDNKRDIIVSSNLTYQAENRKCVHLYLNNGTDRKPVLNFIQNDFLQRQMIDAGSGAYPVFFDYNNDGLKDLLIGNEHLYENMKFKTNLTLYKNIGNKFNPVFEYVTDNYAGLDTFQTLGFHPAFGDLDGDGDDDMLLGDWDGKIHYFNNVAGAGNELQFVIKKQNYLDLGQGQYAAPQIVDVDKDGLPDILAGKKGGTLGFFKNHGTATNPVFDSLANNDTIMNQSSFGNIDVDKLFCCTGYSVPYFYRDSSGNSKLLVGSENGNIYLYSDIDQNLKGQFTLINTFTLPSMRVSIHGADINGDNKPEIVAGEYYGGLSIYQPLWSSGVPEKITTTRPEFNIYPNPFTSHFTVQIRNSDKYFYVFLYDVTGREVWNNKYKTNDRRIDLFIPAAIKPGLYFITLKSENTIYISTVVKIGE